jgi:type II secretory pathway pseudopilin PulG
LDQEPRNEVEEKYYQHLSIAFDAWKGLPEKQKQDRWREECAKAFARKQETHEETKRKLEFAEQEIQHLRSQLAQIHQSEFSSYPSSMLPITRETAANLTNSQDWNFNTLISKHRQQLQSNRSIQHPLPAPSPWAAPTPNMTNNNHTNGGPSYSQYPRGGDQRTPHNEDHEVQSDEDEDLADAPGDEDDMGNQNPPMDRGMLDPHLRDEDGSGEMGEEGAVGGRMLMGLREYEVTGGGEGAGMDMGR